MLFKMFPLNLIYIPVDLQLYVSNNQGVVELQYDYGYKYNFKPFHFLYIGKVALGTHCRHLGLPSTPVQHQ